MISLATFGVEHGSINGSIVSGKVKTAFSTLMAVNENTWPLPNIQCQNVSEDLLDSD